MPNLSTRTDLIGLIGSSQRAGSEEVLDHEGRTPRVSITVTAVPQVTRFDFLYPTLADNEPSGLPEGRDTVADLIALGRAMDEDNSQPSVDSGIPSIQTYFGQFVAHDITWERATESIQLDNNVQPWTLEKIRATLSNSRTSRLDLDSVYGDGNVGEFAPRDDDGR